MQQVRGVVARAKGAPVTIETVNVPDPGPGEAVVQVQADTVVKQVQQAAKDAGDAAKNRARASADADTDESRLARLGSPIQQ